MQMAPLIQDCKLQTEVTLPMIVPARAAVLRGAPTLRLALPAPASAATSPPPPLRPPPLSQGWQLLGGPGGQRRPGLLLYARLELLQDADLRRRQQQGPAWCRIESC